MTAVTAVALGVSDVGTRPVTVAPGGGPTAWSRMSPSARSRTSRAPTASTAPRSPSLQDDRGRRAGLKEVLARRPELNKAAGHVRDFGEILTERLGSRLPTWIDAVDAGQQPGLTGFALHLHRDLDAVAAGLTLHWSCGSIEGAVNRIKKIKRQLLGRAECDLLSKIILLRQHSATPQDLLSREP
ncbi:hypothetical protein [Streptomyces sp. NPDC057438]|uniref:hypothetical protein n=1 Tax=Streptomyces sp. NPDC057438 TaxID=3346133 RepID=UPI00368DC1BD